MCVRLHLHHLAVNAVARADLLAIMEGVGAAADTDAAGPAFAVLRQLVLRWLTDATQYGSRWAAAAVSISAHQLHISCTCHDPCTQHSAALQQLALQQLADAARYGSR